MKLISGVAILVMIIAIVAVCMYEADQHKKDPRNHENPSIKEGMCSGGCSRKCSGRFGLSSRRYYQLPDYIHA